MSSLPLEVEIYCTEERYPVSLQDTGILHLKNHCIVNSEKFSLPTLITNVKQINITDLFSYPNISIPSLTEPIPPATKTSYHFPIKTKISNHESHNDDLINEGIKLRDLEQSVAIAENELFIHEKRNTVSDHYWPTVFITSFFSIVTLALVFVCFQKSRRCINHKLRRPVRGANIPTSENITLSSPHQKPREETNIQIITATTNPKPTEITGTIPKLIPK